MKIKKIILILLIGLVAVLTSGCFITDVVKDIFKKPVVAGKWYNKECDTYIALKDNGNINMEDGKGNVNTGETYENAKREIVFHLDNTIKANETKNDWLMLEKEKGTFNDARGMESAVKM